MANKFIIVPRLGKTKTGFNMGRIEGNVTEFDVIQAATASLVQALDINQIPCDFVCNESQARNEKDRVPLVPPNALVIVVGCGIAEKAMKDRNFSSAVAFGNKNKKRADILLQAMNEWGRIAFFGHGTKKPRYEEDNDYIKDMGWNVPIIEIRPIQINGSNLDDYWNHWKNFGESLIPGLSEIAQVTNI